MRTSFSFFLLVLLQKGNSFTMVFIKTVAFYTEQCTSSSHVSMIKWGSITLAQLHLSCKIGLYRDCIATLYNLETVQSLDAISRLLCNFRNYAAQISRLHKFTEYKCNFYYQILVDSVPVKLYMWDKNINILQQYV